MRQLRTILLILAITLVSLAPASPALARHTCGLDDLDPTLNSVCESHPEDTLARKLFCLISPTC
jgi:hypothetical protein